MSLPTWTPTIVDVAIIWKAPRSLEHMLHRSPNLWLGSPRCIAPLYAILFDYVDIITPFVEVMKVLLERGVDPNESFAGTTPRQLFLIRSIQFRHLTTPSGTGIVIKMLIDHGVDLAIVLDCKGSRTDPSPELLSVSSVSPENSGLTELTS
jgi:hypothetical protein